MKKLLSFEFWQKFGKCLMVVIAVMPAAGLMVSIGNSLPLISDAEWLALVGNIIAQIGWGIIGNLHLLFALAIGVAGQMSVRAVHLPQAWLSF